MAFSDPIVGTEVLIRNQMQSENFSVDPQFGVTGWQLKRDGTATFNNIVFGSPNFTLDPNGDIVAHSITLNAGDTETGIILHGEDIDPELYNNKARGLITIVDLTGSGGDTATETIIGKVIISDYEFGRSYEFGAGVHLDVQTSAPTFVGCKLRAAWDADATNASQIVSEWQWGGRSTSQTDLIETITTEFDENDLPAPGTDLHLSLTMNATVTGTRFQTGPSTRMWVKDIGYLQTRNTWDINGGGGSPPTQKVKTYSCTGSASYQGDGDKRAGVAEAYQGQYSATNGNQFSWLLFDYATIAADLTGATISKVELYLNNNHWYNNSGGTAVIGYHNSATLPDPATYPSGTDDITQVAFTLGQAKWVTISNTIGTAFKNGTAKGIMLGKGPSTSKTYYGYFAGNGQSGEPQLKITYTS
jgi:hypothetical protein